MMKKLVVCVLLCVGMSQAAIITNGDLNTPVIQITSHFGDSTFTLDGSGNVTENGGDTGVDENQWLWTALSRVPQYSANSGVEGSGAFVQWLDNDTTPNQKPRAVAQFANDGGATMGSQIISMDVFMDDNTTDNPLALIVELYAWNSGQTAPHFSLGGPNANDPSYNQTGLGDAVTILKTTVAAVDVADAAWQTVELGTVDLASGYDLYAWRIGVIGQQNPDEFAFDNITVVPEPATLLLLGMGGSVLLRRKK